MSSHHINSVKLDFNFSRRGEKQALEKTRQYFYDKIWPQLNSVLNGVKEHIYIDHIELDLGNLPETELEQAFREHFSKNISETLHRLQPAAAPAPAAVSADEPEMTTARLFAFLSAGYWHWTLQSRKESVIYQLARHLFRKQQVWYTVMNFLQSAGEREAARFLYFLSGDRHSAQLFISAFEKQHPILAPEQQLLPGNWTKLLFSPPGFYHQLAIRLLRRPSLGSAASLLQLLQEMAAEKNIAPHHYSGTAEDKKKTGGRVAKGSTKKTDAARVLAEIQRLINALTASYAGTAAGNTASLPEEKSVVAREQAPAISTMELPQTDTISISNAGLIIFHPFLPLVFRELKWTDTGNQFASEQTQAKAILFLQHLLTAKSRFGEHELVLNKILCNWAPEKPLLTRCNFTRKEKMAAVDMYESLRSYWPVMATTSLAGLRESFIQRQGLLRKTQGGFLLQVEKRTIDILLDSLPISLHTIKLPWNEQIIFTEW